MYPANSVSDLTFKLDLRNIKSEVKDQIFFLLFYIRNKMLKILMTNRFDVW